MVKVIFHAHSSPLYLLHKDEVDGGNEADEGCQMIPMQTLALEEDIGNDGEDDKGNTFLYHLELNQREWSAIVDKAHAVGRHLTTVFKEGYRPTEGYYAY